MTSKADDPAAPRINQQHRDPLAAAGTAYGPGMKALHGHTLSHVLSLPVFSIACFTRSLTAAAFSFTDCSFALASM